MQYNLPRVWYALVLLVVLAIGYIELRPHKVDISELCPQYPVITPDHHFNDSAQFLEDDYIELSAKLLGGAIKIPTQSFDDMDHDVLKEPRLKIFSELHRYFDKHFPLCTANKETINHYGLLYTFPGSDKSLKPILFMAHQDVVPVNPETEDQWKFPPFSGRYDGEYLYGRGSVDTKNTLVAQLEAIENLLAQGWAPKRTLLLSYGFDEECDGKRGAAVLAKEIEHRFGTHGVELIIDEGDGINMRGDVIYATPAVAEKGIVDFNLEMLTPGGHSSMPPDHTGIGILAKLATVLEENPLEASIPEGSILDEILACQGRWDPTITDSYRSILTGLNSKRNRNKLSKILQKNLSTRYFSRTSQAIDVIKGGVKVNALPEKVMMQVDHRIAVHESIGMLQDRLSKFVKDICKEFDIGAEFDGDVIAEGKNGLLNITSFGGYDPAPVSPTKGEIWESIAGVTRSIFPDAIVAPDLMTGNTDTGNYWNVSRNIYRYNPCMASDSEGLHTVNERLGFKSHITAVRWFYEFAVHWTV